MRNTSRRKNIRSIGHRGPKNRGMSGYKDRFYSPFAVEKVPTLNLHGVLCGPEGKSSAPLSQVVILWYERNAERGEHAMSMQLSPQAEELLGQSDLVIITERVDDGALLIGQMIPMGLPEVLDRPIPRHWKQRGLSWGWTAVMWLAHLLTEGDHRKVAVEVSIQGMQHTLSRLTAQVIQPLDVSDDRLSPLLTPLSQPTSWPQIERDLTDRSLAVHALPQAVIRGEATTVSGAHAVTAEGLVAYLSPADKYHRIIRQR